MEILTNLPEHTGKLSDVALPEGLPHILREMISAPMEQNRLTVS